MEKNARRVLYRICYFIVKLTACVCVFSISLNFHFVECMFAFMVFVTLLFVEMI